MNEQLPAWAHDIVGTAGTPVRNGVLCCLTTEGGSGIDYYRAIDGAHMHERAAVSYSMSALDTEAYRAHLSIIRPDSRDAVVVDIGGGDGRNALPWLQWGYKRVVVVDPIASALQRFRQRVAEQNPDWLDNLLLIEADARSLPLVSGTAARVQAIEALYYLNEEYERGLRECVRILIPGGQLLVSERDYEGGLLTRLLHGTLGETLEQAKTRDVWDGVVGLRVRSRSFTREELDNVLESNGLNLIQHRGMSALSLVLSHLRTIGKITMEDDTRLEEVHRLLNELANKGSMRRCHVVVAEKRV